MRFENEPKPWWMNEKEMLAGQSRLSRWLFRIGL